MEDKKAWENQSAEWNRNLFYSKEGLFMKWLFQVSKKKDKILDQGCGVGQYALTAYKYGFKNVVGMDFSNELLIQARKNAKKLKYKIKFVKGDIRKMPFKDHEFNVIISGGIVEHVPETSKAISELSRTIKNNGYLLIHVPQRTSIFTITKLIQQIFGFWKCGYEKSFTKRYFSQILKENNLEILEFSLPPFKAGKHKILGGILEVLDKPLHLIGFGGHHMSFLCQKS